MLCDILNSMTDNTDKNGSKDLGAVFDEHVRHEFEDHNVAVSVEGRDGVNV